MRKLASEFSDASILVSVTGDSRAHGWDLTAAIETEIVAQLRGRNVSAFDDDHDERMRFLVNQLKFSYESWQPKACHDLLLRGELVENSNGFAVSIVIYSADDATYRRRILIRLTSSDIRLGNNIPDLNQKVLKFLEDREGQMIGKGDDSVAAVLPALREFKCRRFGVFTLGRELGPREAVLPGDIIYFANVHFLDPGAAQPRRMPREFMVVSDLDGPGEFKAFYQPIQRLPVEGIVGKVDVDLKGVQSGKVTIFRPTLGDASQLPMTFGPLRKEAPDVDWSSNQPIDLLRYIDPNLDTVRGTWAMKDGKLWFGYERQNKLQIPVYVPSHYSLKFSATRNFGKHGVTVLPVVAGKQVVLTLDGFDGATSGIGLIDGKMEDKNETTYRQQIFKKREKVNVEVQVRGNRLTLLTDGVTRIDWTGDPSRLGLHKVHKVPSRDWIHLGGYESDITISSLTIERIE